VEAHNRLITRLTHTAVDVVKRVRCQLDKPRRGQRKNLVKLCRRLMKVVAQNLEAAPEGGL